MAWPGVAILVFRDAPNPAIAPSRATEQAYLACGLMRLAAILRQDMSDNKLITAARLERSTTFTASPSLAPPPVICPAHTISRTKNQEPRNGFPLDQEQKVYYELRTYFA